MMVLGKQGKNILIGIALGVVIGTVVGLIGAVANLPVAVRGGITGFLVVLGFSLMRKLSLSSRKEIS